MRICSPKLSACASWLVVALSAIAVPNVGIAQQAFQADLYTPEMLQLFFRDVAKQYQFTGKPANFELTPQPILHWSNPVRQQEQGGLFVWTEDGRPVVLASIFSFQIGGNRMMYRHEVISIADKPFVASLNSRVVWEPDASDAKWRELQVARPAASATRRLTQMRAIARTFSGQKTDLQGQVAQLNLMPQPVFRYKSLKRKIVDGAIFGVVEGTDPEIYLLLEAYQSGAGETSWRYAAVQSHWLDMQLSRDGQVVWETKLNRELMNTREGQKPWSQRPYFSFYCNDPIPQPEALTKAPADE